MFRFARRLQTLLHLLLVLALLSPLIPARGAPQAPPAVPAAPATVTADATVAITATGFVPQTVTVPQGATILWVNETGETQRVSSGTPPTEGLTVFLPLIVRSARPNAAPGAARVQRPAAESWDSGPLAPGAGFSHTFTKVGTFDYYNPLAPEMTGRVVVVPPSLTLEPVPDQSVQVGQTLVISLTATYTGNGTLSYGVTPLPANASLDTSTGRFEFTPEIAQVGDISLTFSVTDGTLSDSDSATVTVVGPQPRADLFAIAIGDVITDGVPAPGAGNIETAGSYDVYTFTATAAQSLLFDSLGTTIGGCDLQSHLVAPDGSTVFDRPCYQDYGPFTVDQSGAYTLTVDAAGDVTGTYAFQLLDVPPADIFAIAIGDVVSDGVPEPGAGNIEAAGTWDVYTFTATAGGSLYFDTLSSEIYFCDLGIHLLAPGGGILFNQPCYADKGPYSLSESGSYTLTIDAAGTATGTYSFQLLDVPPPQTFAINIGDVVSDGVPEPGAGNIEAIGAVDVYTFTAQSGQLLYFDTISTEIYFCDLGIHLRAPDGSSIFNQPCFADKDTFALAQSGAYTLTVDGEGTATGAYSFRFLEVPPPDIFAIAIGEVISDGVPEPGAGNIEAIGAWDVYTFTAAAGQTIRFDSQGTSMYFCNLGIRLEAPSGAAIFSQPCYEDKGPYTLSEGGLYTLTVNAGGTATGTYQFQFVEDVLAIVQTAATAAPLGAPAGALAAPSAPPAPPTRPR